jgi:hypothetical protein
MEKLSLSLNVVNGIMQYLNTKPHGEVRALIDAIEAEAKDQLPAQVQQEPEQAAA